MFSNRIEIGTDCLESIGSHNEWTDIPILRESETATDSTSPEEADHHLLVFDTHHILFDLVSTEDVVDGDVF